MKRFFLLFASIVLLGTGCQEVLPLPTTPDSFITTRPMKLTSPAFTHEGSIPSTYTCDGENISPPLAISEVPEGTQSLALIMDDPDAMKPAGKVWDHWLVWNIDSNTTNIVAGEEPTGTHGTGTAGGQTYQGPCPPDAEHRYSFRLYALDTMLDLPSGSTKADLEQAMDGHILVQTELAGKYNRK